MLSFVIHDNVPTAVVMDLKQRVKIHGLIVNSLTWDPIVVKISFFFLNFIFCECFLWQATQKLPICILKFQFFKRLKFSLTWNPMEGEISHKPTPPIVIIIIIMILFQPTFSECSLWQSLQKVAYRNFEKYFFSTRLKLNIVTNGEFQNAPPAQFWFFPLKRFVNVPCDRHRKRYILGFWNSIKKDWNLR